MSHFATGRKYVFLAMEAPVGWVFSESLSADELRDVQSMVTSAGLGAPPMPPTQEAAPAADEAFAQVVAAHPEATVIRGPAFHRSAELASSGGPEADAAFSRLVAANPSATVIAPLSNPAADDADAAFARLAAAHPTATIIRGPAATPEGASEADAAFARLVAANPNATVIAPPSNPATDDADAAFARLAAAHPSATIIRGPASTPAVVNEACVEPAGDGSCSAASGWHFAPSLSPERRAQFEAMISAMPAGHSCGTEGADETAAGDAAFEQMVADHPGARELAPGIWACERE